MSLLQHDKHEVSGNWSHDEDIYHFCSIKGHRRFLPVFNLIVYLLFKYYDTMLLIISSHFDYWEGMTIWASKYKVLIFCHVVDGTFNDKYERFVLLFENCMDALLERYNLSKNWFRFDFLLMSCYFKLCGICISNVQLVRKYKVKLDLQSIGSSPDLKSLLIQARQIQYNDPNWESELGPSHWHPKLLGYSHS